MTLTSNSFFNNNLEKERSSNTLKIEVQSVVIPQSELLTGLINEESITEPTADHDGAFLSEGKYPTLDLVNDPVIVNVRNINENAGPLLEKLVGDDLED